MNKEVEYEVGEMLLCKEYMKVKATMKTASGEDKVISYRCNKNCSYAIDSITDKNIVLKDRYKNIVKNSDLDTLEYEYTIIKTKNDYTVIQYDVYISLFLNVIRSKFMHFLL
jgi:hypothetical protein